MSMLFGTPTDIEFLSMLSQSYKLGFNEGKKEAKNFMDCIPTDKLIELCNQWEVDAEVLTENFRDDRNIEFIC